MKFKKHKPDLIKYSNDLQPVVGRIVASLGYRLCDVSFMHENQTNYLRITILHPEHNITLNDCEFVSREVEKKLDGLNLIPFSYALEVQSPGTDSQNSSKEEHFFTLKDLGLVIKS